MGTLQRRKKTHHQISKILNTKGYMFFEFLLISTLLMAALGLGAKIYKRYLLAQKKELKLFIKEWQQLDKDYARYHQSTKIITR